MTHQVVLRSRPSSAGSSSESQGSGGQRERPGAEAPRASGPRKRGRSAAAPEPVRSRREADAGPRGRRVLRSSQVASGAPAARIRGGRWAGRRRDARGTGGGGACEGGARRAKRRPRVGTRALGLRAAGAAAAGTGSGAGKRLQEPVQRVRQGRAAHQLCAEPHLPTRSRPAVPRSRPGQDARSRPRCDAAPVSPSPDAPGAGRAVRVRGRLVRAGSGGGHGPAGRRQFSGRQTMAQHGVPVRPGGRAVEPIPRRKSEHNRAGARRPGLGRGRGRGAWQGSGCLGGRAVLGQGSRLPDAWGSSVPRSPQSPPRTQRFAKCYPPNFARCPALAGTAKGIPPRVAHLGARGETGWCGIIGALPLPGTGGGVWWPE